MKKRMALWLIVLLLMVSAVVVFTIVGCGDNNEGRIAELEAEIAERDARIDELESKINDLDARIDELETRIDDLEVGR